MPSSAPTVKVANDEMPKIIAIKNAANEANLNLITFFMVCRLLLLYVFPICFVSIKQ